MKKVKLLALTKSVRDFGLGVFIVECYCHKDGQTSKKDPQEEFHSPGPPGATSCKGKGAGLAVLFISQI